MTSLPPLPPPAHRRPRIGRTVTLRIEEDTAAGVVIVIGDEVADWARVTGTWPDIIFPALDYARELLYGPGTRSTDV